MLQFTVGGVSIGEGEKIVVRSDITPRAVTDPNADASGYIWCQDKADPTKRFYARGTCPSSAVSQPMPAGANVGKVFHNVDLPTAEQATYIAEASSLAITMCPNGDMDPQKNAMLLGLLPFAILSGDPNALVSPTGNEPGWLPVSQAPAPSNAMAATFLSAMQGAKLPNNPWGKFYSTVTRTYAIKRLPKPRKPSQSVGSWFAGLGCDIVNSPITAIAAGTALTLTGAGPVAGAVAGAALNAGKGLCAKGGGPAAPSPCVGAGGAMVGTPRPWGTYAAIGGGVAVLATGAYLLLRR